MGERIFDSAILSKAKQKGKGEREVGEECGKKEKEEKERG